MWTHAALLAALVTVVVATLRVFAWMGFQTNSALAVLSVTERATLLAASLILVGQAILPVVLGYLLWNSSASFKNFLPRQGQSEWAVVKNWGQFIAIAAIVWWGLPALSVLVICGLSLLVLAPILIARGIARARRKQEAKVTQLEMIKADLGEQPINEKGADANAPAGPSAGRAAKVEGVGPIHALPVFSALQLSLAVFFAAWMPLEVVQFHASDKPIVGYVVGSQQEFTLVVTLNKEPRWVQSDEIESRALCSRPVGGWELRTMQALYAPADLPPCPDS